MSCWRGRASIVRLLLVAALLGAAAVHAKPGDVDRAVNLKTSPVSEVGDVDERLLRPFEIMARVSRINLVAQDVYSLAGDNPAASVAIEMFPGEPVTFDFNRREDSLVGSRTWNGYLRDETSEGYLTLTASARSVSGVAEIGFERYVFHSINPEEALVGQVDDTRSARCLMPHVEREGRKRPLATPCGVASRMISLVVASDAAADRRDRGRAWSAAA
jgi:hypothetical protein